jgi:hypothetical protein
MAIFGKKLAKKRENAVLEQNSKQVSHFLASCAII